MVLARNEHPAGVDFRDRVVGAVMTELHLQGLRTARQPQQLVAQTNTEHRYVGFQKREIASMA
jgi:hypothetical protein